MDLESERSALVSVEDNELVAREGLGKNGEIETKMKDNGKHHAENVDNKLLDDIKVEGTIGKTPLLPGASIRSSPSPATKGRGLRKWRRIPREAAKEKNSSLDSNRKRGLTALPVEMKQRSDGSTSSTNAMVNALGNALDHGVVYGDSGLGGGPDSPARADSDNSEDRNSRSSTAASAPRAKHEIPAVTLGLDLNMMRSLKGNSSGVSVQPRDQQEKNRNGTSKKARGAKIKKEKSYSSMESDSRSSNYVFVQGTSSVTSNGRQSGRSGNYDEEYSDDAQNGVKHLNEQTQTGLSKNEADSKDVSQEDLAAENSWEVKEEKVNDHVGSVNRDALIESIIPLHLVQEALEREVQKLRDVGKEDALFSDDSVQPSGSSSVDPQGNEPRSFEEFQSGESRRKQNEAHLQGKLEEARVIHDLKDAKISELESTLNFGDMTELEEIVRQRFEAELEYIVISKTIQNFKADPIDRINLMVQKKNLAAPEQVQLDDVGNKAATFETIEDAWKLQNRVCRYASCFTIQSVLLLVVLYLFILQLSSQTMEVVPT